MRRNQVIWRVLRSSMLVASLSSVTALATSAEQERGFIPRLVNSSTIPVTGDVNPYGVAFVPEGFPSGGTIATGDVLVSNFNNSANAQGTGTTIVQLTPHGTLAPPGSAATFFTSSLPGLSTALGVLRRGFVVVGNVPTTDGTINTIGQVHYRLSIGMERLSRPGPIRYFSTDLGTWHSTIAALRRTSLCRTC